MDALTAPWEAVGTDVSGAGSTQEALELAGLNWGVEHTSVGARLPRSAGGSYKRIPHLQAVIRTDTWEPLGVAGDIHTLVPNQEAFTAMDVLRDMEDVELISAGELKGGRQVFLLGRLAQGFEIAGERHDTLLLQRNQHDGRGGLILGVSAFRVPCRNQLPGLVAATKRGTAKQGQAFWNLRHTTTVSARMEVAYQNLQRAIDLQRAFEEVARELITRPFTTDDMARYAEALYPTEGTKVAPRTATRNAERQEQILAIYKGSENLENIRDTAYGAYNAVAEWADHGFAFRATRRASLQENRMLSVMDAQGTAYQLKERAAALVVKLSSN